MPKLGFNDVHVYGDYINNGFIGMPNQILCEECYLNLLKCICNALASAGCHVSTP